MSRSRPTWPVPTSSGCSEHRDGGRARTDPAAPAVPLPVLRRRGTHPVWGVSRRLAVPFLSTSLHRPTDRHGSFRRMTTALRPTPLLAQAADAWFDGIEDPVEQALTVLKWAGDTFGDDFAITSSMADGLLAHLASEAVPGIKVVFVDTGYHFAETIGTRDWITSVLPVTLVNVRPEQSVAEQDATYGERLHERDPDLCCSLRKVRPLAEQLSGYVAWGSGIRRDEGAARADTRIVDWDDRRGMLKINPIA